MLERIVTLLVEPQSVDNVGATIRALMNMGLSQLRLVRPAPFDPGRLPVIAHRSQTIVAGLQTFDSLADALADTVYVVGCTSRRRDTNRPVLSPRDAARTALTHARSGPVAFVFGREDMGLGKADLDHCHALLTIPTVPDYASLNLAQAVIIVAYELRLAALADQLSVSESPTPLATGAQTETMFASLEAALSNADFLIPSRAEATMRALRALLLRGQPTAEEVALITAMVRALTR